MNRSSKARPLALVWWACLSAVLVVGAPARPAGAQPPPSAPAPAPAAEGSLTWSVRPTPSDAAPDASHFSYELAAGSTATGSIRVRNYTTAPLPLDVYAADALLTGGTSMDLVPAGTASTGVGIWVELDRSTIEVPAGDHVDVPFTVTVPADAEPGDHAGGIVTSYQTTGREASGRQVVVDQRLGSRFHVRVTGDLRPEVTIEAVNTSFEGTANPFGSGTVQVRYVVANTGNVRVAASPSVTAAGPFGSFSRTAATEVLEDLLPGDRREVTTTVSGVRPTVRTTATVKVEAQPVRPGDDFAPVTSSDSAAAWSIPWTALVLLAALAATPVAVTALRRRRRQREAQLVADAVEQALAQQP